MTSQLTYLLDAVLGRSAVKFSGKSSPSHTKDPCAYCPNNDTPSGVVLIDADGKKVFLCQTCAALVNNFDLDGMTQKLQREISADDGPAPWWLWKKERHRRELSIRNTALNIAHSYFHSMRPDLAPQKG